MVLSDGKSSNFLPQAFVNMQLSPSSQIIAVCYVLKFCKCKVTMFLN